ncbi:MAG: DUF72 domain-containing protein [Actinomycetota bacterium]|nr:DUF72 domain-containing protein [Actinomycetota bacterium]
MGRVRVGTASWTDKTLVKESDFYPQRSMTAEQRLRHYASIFTLVEVDATYYFPPTQELAGLWATRTPQDFRMDVKAYSLLTHHPTSRRSLWADVAADLVEERREGPNVYLSHLPASAVDRAWHNFGEALLPLHSAGKLGAVFFQFPSWFRPGRASRAYLEQLPERLPEYQVAVEFRHGSWLSDEDDRRRTLELLERLGVAYVCVDEPQGFESSMPPVLVATADLAVVRFHGHNRDTWEARNISPAERFRYLYGEEELAGWAPRVRQLAGGARETHVVFNNCYRDYGVRNAQQMIALLTSENE